METRMKARIYDHPDDSLDCFMQLFKRLWTNIYQYEKKKVRLKQQPDWFNQDIANANSSGDKIKQTQDHKQLNIGDKE